MYDIYVVTLVGEVAWDHRVRTVRMVAPSSVGKALKFAFPDVFPGQYGRKFDDEASMAFYNVAADGLTDAWAGSWDGYEYVVTKIEG